MSPFLNPFSASGSVNIVLNYLFDASDRADMLYEKCFKMILHKNSYGLFIFTVELFSKAPDLFYFIVCCYLVIQFNVIPIKNETCNAKTSYWSLCIISGS